MATQVVDVPMRRARPPAVVGDARGEPAGPAGASRVCVETGFELEGAQGADPDPTGPGRFEDQYVGSGFRRRGGSRKSAPVYSPTAQPASAFIRSMNDRS